MLPFPIGINGSIQFEPAVVTNRTELTIKAITLLLKEGYVRSLSVDGCRIRFTAHMCKPGNPAAAYNGAITVKEKANAIIVEYRLSMIEPLLMSAAASGVLAVFDLVFFGADRSTALIVFGSGWLWFFGANYIIATVLFPRWLKRLLLRKIIVS